MYVKTDIDLRIAAILIIYINLLLEALNKSLCCIIEQWFGQCFDSCTSYVSCIWCSVTSA